jgi:AraC family transcriptional regulator of arabinose operon
MPNVNSPKYRLNDGAFRIQYMHRTGYYAMSKPHSHKKYEIYYLLQGERIYFINDRLHLAQKGDMVLINPHVLHSTSSTVVPEYERILIQFRPGFITPEMLEPEADLLPFAQGSGIVRFSEKEQQAVEQLLREMVEECENLPQGCIPCVRSLMVKLLIMIHRAGLRKGADDQNNVRYMNDKVAQVAAYINEHYKENLNLERLAKEFYISPFYLSRIFKNETGFNFREYLQLVRITEAQRRLRETKERVPAIAEATGFEHLAHFYKTFKKVVGTSPLQYRKGAP